MKKKKSREAWENENKEILTHEGRKARGASKV